MAGETTIKIRCSVCGWTLRALSVSNIATEIRSVTCRKCRAPHTIKTSPLRILTNGVIHRVELAPTRAP